MGFDTTDNSLDRSGLETAGDLGLEVRIALKDEVDGDEAKPSLLNFLKRRSVKIRFRPYALNLI